MEQADFRKEIKNRFFSSENGQIYRSIINETERILIEEALARTQGNQIGAAHLLGVNRNTLRLKIRKFNINTEKLR